MPGKHRTERHSPGQHSNPAAPTPASRWASAPAAIPAPAAARSTRPRARDIRSLRGARQPGHSTRARFRLLGPVATAAIVTAVFAGGAYAVTRASDGNLAEDTPAGQLSASQLSTSDSQPAPTGSTTPSAASASSATPEASTVREPGQVSRGNTRTPAPSSGAVVSTGTCGASYYDEPQGTANGETFDPEALTAAHKTLKFNTRVRVTNVDNGKSVIVRINDRGPYIDGRCLDLSRAAFRAIEDLGAGHTTVRYEVLG